MTVLPWLERGTSEIFPDQPDSSEPQENLVARLQSTNRPLRVKLGIDPTGADIHLGHSIAMRKLRAFQDAGHKAVLIIGDFTARIGDPTGKSEVRKQLTAEQVKQNAETYLEQMRPILDFSEEKLEIRYNSEWLSKLDLGETLSLLATMTVSQMLAKEGFDKRYKEETPIYLHEFLYPLMQGYDSVAVEADVELGGTDQKFNLAVGRDLQRHFGRKDGSPPQFGLLMPILIGTDGQQKMSKSLGNYVGLGEAPLSMYSKLEKVPDVLIEDYFTLLTDLSLAELPENPRDRQKLLALNITTQYHGEAAAQEAQKASLELVQGDAKQAEAVPECSIAEAMAGLPFPAKLFVVLGKTGLCASSSDAKRQVKGGAVKIDGEKQSNPDQMMEKAELAGKVMQVGKKRFVRLVE